MLVGASTRRDEDRLKKPVIDPDDVAKPDIGHQPRT
jgi:hypothetical protein